MDMLTQIEKELEVMSLKLKAQLDANDRLMAKHPDLFFRTVDGKIMPKGNPKLTLVKK